MILQFFPFYVIFAVIFVFSRRLLLVLPAKPIVGIHADVAIYHRKNRHAQSHSEESEQAAAHQHRNQHPEAVQPMAEPTTFGPMTFPSSC